MCYGMGCVHEDAFGECMEDPNFPDDCVDRQIEKMLTEGESDDRKNQETKKRAKKIKGGD